MKCPKCGSEKITVVNRPIQLEEKTNSGTMTFLITVAIITLFVGIIMLAAAPKESSSADIPSTTTTQMAEYAAVTPPSSSSSNSGCSNFLNSPTAYVVGAALTKWSAITLLTCGIINSLRPHKWNNKLIGVCMDCGHSAALKAFKEKTEENTEPVSEEENKQE
ncbi:MAG: hypothetical protein VZQ61_05345 [Christensenellaceae bacterium]